ncbi:MAG: RNA polymerase factor sigma-54 [Candidatus Nitrohelix vancouverensis]|uniref:RNA polymerase factor sigma-54 n=1 Tax=Candidatus Nitrohelix vancouverensis TaxID=2705534 RepID=A0A7T0C368_9BACT|nr:MAG: RNA polymerase factor sigma-54 [Candidatus Nitrohelix vancouverensis]
MGMEMKMGLGLKMTQKLVMTPMLQQAIKLLPLARLELAQLVQQEMVDNPLLEELEENDEEISQDTEEDLEAPDNDLEEAPLEEFSVEETLAPVNGDDESASETVAEQEIDWDNFIQSNLDGGMSADSYTERPSIEATYRKEPSLSEHLHWQLNLAVDSDKDKFIGACIIGNIQSDGYLICGVEEISADCSEPVEDVQRVLAVIQTFEPTGVGARSLKECLMIQARSLPERIPLVEELIENFLERLEDRRIPKIASELKLDIETVLNALQIIRCFQPKPGMDFSSEKIDYVVPDVVVVKTEEGYDLALNDDEVPRLRINPYYHDLLKTASEGQTREYLENKYKSALWLIKSIDQRRQTIYKVGKSIIKLQKEFLDKGLSYLRPMVLKDVALDIEMHESTVSRITTNKYIDTPQGIYELKFFFHSGIRSCEGSNNMSSVRVKNMIKEIVAQEDSTRPLTDDQMVAALVEKNAKIARRTITKYRKELNIPPANKRKRLI